MASRPQPEITLTPAVIHRLVLGQFPALADLQIQEVSRGWDNTNFRLGDELLVRVPHRQVANQLIHNEQQWLPLIASQVELPVPVPIHQGTPTTEYPWQWSITPWFDGSEAAGAALTNSKETASTLGHFFHQLHTTAPDNTPPNPYRGCPLRDRRESFLARLGTLDNSYDKQLITSLFDQACAAESPTDRVWLHGDLHGRNMIVNHGRLAAVIDWGDICAGDRATDLAGAFMLVPDDLATVHEHAGTSDADWQRARGWALNFAVIYLAMSDDDPVMVSIGTRLLATLLAA